MNWHPVHTRIAAHALWVQAWHPSHDAEEWFFVSGCVEVRWQEGEFRPFTEVLAIVDADNNGWPLKAFSRIQRGHFIEALEMEHERTLEAGHAATREREAREAAEAEEYAQARREQLDLKAGGWES
jgi:hypothetical protein